MKSISIMLLIVALIGCTHRDRHYDGQFSVGTGRTFYKIVTIDECEYIAAHYRLTHKGNCIFCQQRLKNKNGTHNE
jgi:hypothetical protein